MAFYLSVFMHLLLTGVVRLIGFVEAVVTFFFHWLAVLLAFAVFLFVWSSVIVAGRLLGMWEAGRAAFGRPASPCRET
jgi:hypothetical protein